MFLRLLDGVPRVVFKVLGALLRLPTPLSSSFVTGVCMPLYTVVITAAVIAVFVPAGAISVPVLLPLALDEIALVFATLTLNVLFAAAEVIPGPVVIQHLLLVGAVPDFGVGYGQPELFVLKVGHAITVAILVTHPAVGGATIVEGVADHTVLVVFIVGVL